MAGHPAAPHMLSARVTPLPPLPSSWSCSLHWLCMGFLSVTRFEAHSSTINRVPTSHKSFYGSLPSNRCKNNAAAFNITMLDCILIASYWPSNLCIAFSNQKSRAMSRVLRCYSLFGIFLETNIKISQDISILFFVQSHGSFGCVCGPFISSDYLEECLSSSVPWLDMNAPL